MNKLYLVANYFGNHTDMADAVTSGIMSFEQDEVAGLGSFFTNSFTNLTLSRAGMRERNAKLIVTETGETGAIESPGSRTARAIPNRKVLFGKTDHLVNSWNSFVKTSLF